MTNEKLGLVIILVIAIVGVSSGVRSYIRERTQEQQLAPFYGSIDGYIDPYGLKDPVGIYRRGKVIVVNPREKTVDDIYFDLPEKVRATSPNEVGTIILLEWTEDVVGHYAWGGQGYVHTAKVLVIDKAMPALMINRIFRGSDPPSKKIGRGDAYGSKPTGEIISFIMGLPEKEMISKGALAVGGGAANVTLLTDTKLNRTDDIEILVERLGGGFGGLYHLGGFDSEDGRRLSITLRVTNHTDTYIQLGELESAPYRFLNPSVLVDDTGYSRSMLAEEGLEVEDDGPIAPRETRTLTITVKNSAWDTEKKNPAWDTEKLSSILSDLFVGQEGLFRERFKFLNNVGKVNIVQAK